MEFKEYIIGHNRPFFVRMVSNKKWQSPDDRIPLLKAHIEQKKDLLLTKILNNQT